MSMLDELSTSGEIKEPFFFIIYGTPGVGKTTFVSKMPNPYCIDVEEGSKQIKDNNFKRQFVDSMEDIYKVINLLLTEKHDRESFIIDSLDKLVDKLIVPPIEEKKKMPILKMKWGAGVALINKELEKLVGLMNRLREEKGMNIAIVAHSKVKQTNNPSLTEDFDKTMLRVYESTASFMTREVGNLLFATSEIFTHINEEGKVKGVGGGRRIIHTIGMPGYDAKNRFNLPGTLNLNWDEFIDSCNKSSDRDVAAVQANISELVNCLKDDKTKKVVFTSITNAKGDMEQLLKIETRLKELTNN